MWKTEENLKGVERMPIFERMGKNFALIPEILLAFLCVLYYAVTLFRGRGLVKTDIGTGSTLFLMVKDVVPG